VFQNRIVVFPSDVADCIAPRHDLHVFSPFLVLSIGQETWSHQETVKNANPGLLMKALYGLLLAPIISISGGFRAHQATDSTVAVKMFRALSRT